MANQFDGIYDPLIFDAAVQESAIEQNRFVAAGVMTNDERIAAMASGPGSVGELPFFFGLTNDEPNYSSKDPAVKSTPALIDGGVQMYCKAMMNKSWSTMDLNRELGLQDPLGAIIGRAGKYWAVNDEKRLIQTIHGIVADNLANDGGDMVHAIHNEEGTAATAANQISAPAVIDTQATMGDAAGLLGAIAMHSMQYTLLKKQNLIDFIPNSRGEVNIPTYLGMVVVQDDSLLPRAGTTDGLVYTVILFSPGAVAYGQGMPEVPSETDRIPDAGNGGGQDVIYSRATNIIHPYGFAFDKSGGTPVVGLTPTYAELADATKWNRVYEHRKNIGVAVLTCN